MTIFRSTSTVLIDIYGNPVEVATETTLAALATEVKLEAVRVLLQTISNINFASETKLEAVRALIQTLAAEDFATETTLAGIKTGTDKIPASPSQEHTTAVSPHSTRLTDGTAFYKATTPADTQPVSAAALPLPTGAATESTLTGIKTGTDKIPASPAQEHVVANSPHSTRLTDGSAFYKATTPSDTQPVSASSLPLPTGASTETTLLKSSRGDVRYLKRFDIGAATIYTGYAPNGTSASSSGWTIKKTTLDGSGNPTVEEWTAEGSAIWNNRASENYS